MAVFLYLPFRQTLAHYVVLCKIAKRQGDGNEYLRGPGSSEAHSLLEETTVVNSVNIYWTFTVCHVPLKLNSEQ